MTNNGEYTESYEFVIDQNMSVVECVRVESDINGLIRPIDNAAVTLDGMLFELNHVRVNPRVDNSHIIQCLTSALHDVGVEVRNSPANESIAMCFKPLGEISDNVRFYLNNKTQIIFLSPAGRPQVVKNSDLSAPTS